MSIGLPWRRESSESSKNSDCSICKLEKSKGGLPKSDACNILLHKVTRQNAADQEESVFTGRISFTIEYQNEVLVLKRITAEGLLPWRYTSLAKTFVTVDVQVGDVHDKRSSEVQTGVHSVTYERELQFRVCDTNLDHAQLDVTVWQTGDEHGGGSSVGECSVAMDTVTTTPGLSLDISRKLFKKSVSDHSRNTGASQRIGIFWKVFVIFNPLMASVAFSILLWLTPDDFTRQWETSWPPERVKTVKLKIVSKIVEPTKKQKGFNYFTLCVLNLKFSFYKLNGEIEKKTFSQYSNFLRCTLN